MPTHPLPPTDLRELVDAYAQVGQAILDLGVTCRPADFALPTQRSGWTVQDQFSHVVSAENLLAGGVEEPVTVPEGERHDFRSTVARAVESRRRRHGTDVVGEWRRLLPRRVRALRDPALTEDTLVAGPHGQAPLREVLSQRIIDLWVHEQDLRQALDRPGDLDTAAAAAFTTQILDALAVRVASRVPLPLGSAVIVEVTGPVMAREGVRLVPAEDGSVTGELLFSGTAHVDTPDEETGEIVPLPPGSTTTIRLSTEELTRRGADRVPTADLRYAVDGDEAVARQVLDALVVAD